MAQHCTAACRSRCATPAAYESAWARSGFLQRRRRAIWASLPPHCGAARACTPQVSNLGGLHMNVQSRMSDIQGLTKVAPVSRRLLMTASAATAAGYTIAAGPVRADAIKTDTTGLVTGEAKIAVPGGEMPVYFAQARERRKSAGHPGGDGDFRAPRVHQGRDASPRQARRLRGRARLLLPQGRSHQDHRDADS